MLFQKQKKNTMQSMKYSLSNLVILKPIAINEYISKKYTQQIICSSYLSKSWLCVFKINFANFNPIIERLKKKK